ncbi:MAG: two-component sensor histidine kinase [Firmicutes bacterium HGW-Firmicutes-12]|nr:MAG: two-component sensor histidine kinase [Firmicutes bacterium HGW-Firmicutes-12]
MDIKSKSFSHSIITKLIVFIITILCFTCAITVFLDIAGFHRGDFEIVFEKDYYHSSDYENASNQVIQSLSNLIEEYKSEEHILEGGTITQEEIASKKDSLYRDWRYNRDYNTTLSEEQGYERFEELYADEIEQIKGNLISEDLKQYNSDLRRLDEYNGIIYYGSDGENIFTNSTNPDKEFFKGHPSYLIFDKAEATVFPEDIKENNFFYWLESSISNSGQQDKAVYVAFTPQFLESRIGAWNSEKAFITYCMNQIIGFTLGLVVAFIYLLVIIGRKFFGDKDVHLNFVDSLYTDINIVICLSLIGLWFGSMNFIVFENKISQAIFPITLLIGTIGLIFVLSLVKRIKNGSLIKHSLTFAIFYKLFKLIKDIYDSGSIGIKVALIVIGYPMIVALTFFIFPLTIGFAVWLAFKKVKEFKAIKEGVTKVKEGELNYKIDIVGKGEFAQLASDINGITDGLNKAVANEVKSERLKTELITNVSHDIRTPLTSIITYVDLLKHEKEQAKVEEYLEVIDQKSQRLKTLTEDLFEAAKASSGSIPVNYEEIDIVSLITQGLGELNDKIKELKLDFKINYPSDKVYIKADGKLLWRALENLLSNIFKYALEGSRVYIDIEDLGQEVKLVIKNISAYELNISSDELMERFKRGDEARTSQGNGLGLSIAKSLIEVQRGSFHIEIDGDLFKAILQMPK